MLIGQGQIDRYLTSDELRTIVRSSLESLQVDVKRVLILIPDGTRTMPMPFLLGLFDEFLGTRVRKLDYLVALGTHPPMTDAQLSVLVGRPVVNGCAGKSRIYNHRWDRADSLSSIGRIPSHEIEEITGGLMRQSVPISVNRLIYDYDQLIICGPVFPHEVVGFSGGNKYFIPGIAGSEIVNFTHWLGAVMTSYKIIGAGYTPVRAVIDRAAAMIDRPVACFSLVVTHAGISGMFFGSARESWQAAASLSAQKHIVYVEKPYQRVLSIMPTMYEDLWTAAKGMYKLEPVVSDGGEIVILAPHVSEVSRTHGKLIHQLGYHCRDYYLKQWDRYKDYPGGVLAHSTHLKGLGSYDPKMGIESPRIQVTLATGIPEDACRAINLGYQDPVTIDMKEWEDREDEGILVVPRAGEILYRLKEKNGEI
jgi:nickel-dependent lactate racemase